MFFKTIVLILDISCNVVATPSFPIPECFQPPKGISKDLKKLAPLMIAPPHSNLSAILNELVRENKLEKIAGRPVLYKIHNKLDEDDSIFNQLIGFNGSLAKSIQDIISW